MLNVKREETTTREICERICQTLVARGRKIPVFFRESLSLITFTLLSCVFGGELLFTFSFKSFLKEWERTQERKSRKEPDGGKGISFRSIHSRDSRLSLSPLVEHEKRVGIHVFLSRD